MSLARLCLLQVRPEARSNLHSRFCAIPVALALVLAGLVPATGASAAQIMAMSLVVGDRHDGQGAPVMIRVAGAAKPVGKLPKARVRDAGKARPAGKAKQVAKTRPAGKAKQVAKTKPAGKAKQVAKTRPAGKAKQVAKNSTPARQAKAAARAKPVGKPSSAKRDVVRPARLARAPLKVAAASGPLPTMGMAFGLHAADDPLSLRSSVALVFDPDSRETLFEKNANAVLPIASITKLMTAMVVLDAGQDMKEMLEVTRDDIDRLRNSHSRLGIGTRLSRGEMMQLALMSSENRAANALGRHYPGGLTAFVSAMNAKARLIGMLDTAFADPTGLSGSNVSSAIDLARLVAMASDYPAIRQLSTAETLQVDTGFRRLTFGNTNRLVVRDDWEIGLQKTGYISEAGRCLVMAAEVNGRRLIFVLLDSNGSASRFADAQRLRAWLLTRQPEIHAAGEPLAVN